MSDESDVEDPAANQLVDFAHKVGKHSSPSATTQAGNPIPYLNASLTIGKYGPTLFQDRVLFDELTNFARERIPERVVHAKGAGAFGYFEVTHDITQYTAAKVFSHVGKKTPIAVRFSQVTGEMGSSDTVRDLRGFPIKFYTEDGIWDLVGNGTPIFFIREAMLFPSVIRILKRNPVTHLPDWNMFWDFMTLRPESVYQVLFLYSDRGIPSSYAAMDGWGSHTFGLVNSEGKFFYCKFHYPTDQGVSALDVKTAAKIASADPNYYIRDLYNRIAKKDYPSWSFSIQVMTPKEAAHCPFDPFDLTKIWPVEDYPLIPVGRFVLNRNPKNYFAEVEQIGFDPAHMIPGIEPSPDRMLQARLFAYGDTHRYRIGPNHLQLPVNSPSFPLHNYARDGKMNYDNQGGAPNYHPNSFGGPKSDQRAHDLAPIIPLHGDAGRYDNGGDEWDNYSQARDFYKKMLKPDERIRVAENIVETLQNAAEFLQRRAVGMFSKVDQQLGHNIEHGLNAKKGRSAAL